ncbi:MAG: PilZ domain-containing protein [Myxococcota bacterium]
MNRPSVLLVDDGELGTIRELLTGLGAQFEDLRGPDATAPLPEAERLLVTTARRADAHELRRGISSLSKRAVWIAFVDGNDPTDRTPLQLKGFDFLVREPVHPMAMRLLLLRALYQGDDKRQVRREAFGYLIEFETASATASGTLTDLSARGCRLFTQQPPQKEEKLSIRIPAEVAGGTALELPGTVLRTGPATAEGGDDGDTSVGISFDTLEPELRKRLRKVLIQRSTGPAVLPGSPSGSHGGKRRQQRGSFGSTLIAMSEGAAYALLGLDLSEGGMRVERNAELAVGDRLRLAIHPRTEPFLVEAVVVRDDGDRGLALRFDWVEPGAKEELRELVRGLPMIEVLEEGEVKATIMSQILPRGVKG